MNFNCGHLSAECQGYSLTFWPKMAHFHHFSICNQNQWISILVIFRQNTKVIALLFGQQWLIENEPFLAITFQSGIEINEFQFWSFVGKIPRLYPYFLDKSGSFSSLFNLQSRSMNFNFGHFWAKYQGYSLTFWPKMAHFHHFSICNQNQWISFWSFVPTNTKVVPLLFWPKMAIFITFQSAIKINEFQFWSFFGNIPRLTLVFCRQMTKIEIHWDWKVMIADWKVMKMSHFWPKSKAITLVFSDKWPKLKFIDFDCRLKSDDNEPFWPKVRL